MMMNPIRTVEKAKNTSCFVRRGWCCYFVGVWWRMMMMIMILTIYMLPTSHCFVGVGKSPSVSFHNRATTRVRPLCSVPTDTTKKEEQVVDNNNNNNMQDEDAPAGIVGAEFFGGNKQKAEFYDPVAEAQAAVEQEIEPDQQSIYDRFATTNHSEAFPDPLARVIAQDLQRQINTITATSLVASERSYDDDPTNRVAYADDCTWQTALPVTMKNPLQELQNGASFYRQMALAITSASTSVSSSLQDSSKDDIITMQLRFELSVLWPTIWEPRVMLTGTSQLKLNRTNNNNKNDNKFIIVSQMDTLDENWTDSIRRQILPRFWDLYHIGMTPAAELPSQTMIAKRNIFQPYDVVELPPRWYLETEILSGDREDCDASYIPNPSFTCVIKTMGPMKQSFTPVSGMRIDILIQPSSQQQQQLPSSSSATTTTSTNIRFQIPLAVEYAAQTQWILPESGQYVFYPRTRRIATIPCGCDPQDPIEIPKLRQRLYEAVIRDGKYRPKMMTTTTNNVGTNRPIFFYINDVAKACYTQEGLGMAVYEWRPFFTQPNRIGLELEYN